MASRTEAPEQKPIVLHRIRGTISGIAAAFSYFTIFVGTKTYIDLERSLSIAGTFALYAVLTALG